MKKKWMCVWAHVLIFGFQTVQCAIWATHLSDKLLLYVLSPYLLLLACYHPIYCYYMCYHTICCYYMCYHPICCYYMCYHTICCYYMCYHTICCYATCRCTIRCCAICCHASCSCATWTSDAWWLSKSIDSGTFDHRILSRHTFNVYLRRCSSKI